METHQPHRTRLWVWGTFNWITVANVTETTRVKTNRVLERRAGWGGGGMNERRRREGWGGCQRRTFGSGGIPAEGWWEEKGGGRTSRTSRISVAQRFDLCSRPMRTSSYIHTSLITALQNLNKPSVSSPVYFWHIAPIYFAFCYFHPIRGVPLNYFFIFVKNLNML